MKASAGPERVFGILGGGFGLYGWLPAVARFTDQPIHTLARYEPTLRRRPELTRFIDRLVFAVDRDAVLSRCETLLCAQRPADQAALVRDALDQDWKGNFLLEKPLAPTPGDAIKLFDRLSSAGNGLAVGFSLQATSWAHELVRCVQQEAADRVETEWTFQAHHYRHDVTTWKRHPSEGGGALRFFAIHLLAVLSQCGDWTVDSANLSTEDDLTPGFDASLRLGHCRGTIRCDSNHVGEPRFEVKISRAGEPLFRETESDPLHRRFELPGELESTGKLAAEEDGRVLHLLQLLHTAERRAWRPPAEIRRHLNLWQAIEQAAD